jgi:AhpC/TSA family
VSPRPWHALALFFFGLCLAAPLAAQEIKPFEAGTLKQIVAAHKNRPFVLALWSLTCPHCRNELASLGEALHGNPACDLVLVSTDSPEDGAALAAALARLHLEDAQAWVFADAFTERLRYAVDRDWQGELPRTYLYGADGSIQAVSGKLAPRQLRRWIERQTAAVKRP